MIGLFTVVLVLGAVAGYYRWKAYAAPWISAAIPRVKLEANGVQIVGTDRVFNTGNATALQGKFGYYVLYVPPNDPEKDVYRRMKYSDRSASLQELGNIAPSTSTSVHFDAGTLGAGSNSDGVVPSYLEADRYVRLLLTYHDSHGHLHHTYRCYQIAQRPNQRLSVWSCPLEDVTD